MTACEEVREDRFCSITAFFSLSTTKLNQSRHWADTDLELEKAGLQNPSRAKGRESHKPRNVNNSSRHFGVFLCFTVGLWKHMSEQTSGAIFNTNLTSLLGNSSSWCSHQTPVFNFPLCVHLEVKQHSRFSTSITFNELNYIMCLHGLDHIMKSFKLMVWLSRSFPDLKLYLIKALMWSVSLEQEQPESWTVQGGHPAHLMDFSIQGLASQGLPHSVLWSQ